MNVAAPWVTRKVLLFPRMLVSWMQEDTTMTTGKKIQMWVGIAMFTTVITLALLGFNF